MGRFELNIYTSGFVAEGGEACWSAVVFCCKGLLLKTSRGKWQKGGQALIAAELRCDALIAPSGCGQCPGEEHEHSASGAAVTLCQMSSLALMWYVGCTRIRLQMCLVTRKHNTHLCHKIPAVPLFWHLERPGCSRMPAFSASCFLTWGIDESVWNKHSDQGCCENLLGKSDKRKYLCCQASRRWCSWRLEAWRQ